MGRQTESVSRTLAGKVAYHDEIRKWFELVLDTPTCGQSAVQLLQGCGAFEVDEGNGRAIEEFRGCHVTVDGPLGIPGTGYYCADIYQNADKIDPDQGCLKQPPLPDYSKTKADSSIRKYRVRMRMDYSARGGKIEVMVRSGDKSLTPWQAYASYWLTGGYVFYGNCAENFAMSHVRGTPEANPRMVDNQASLDPESAAAKHIRWVTLEFTCRKEVRAASRRSDR